MFHHENEVEDLWSLLFDAVVLLLIHRVISLEVAMATVQKVLQIVVQAANRPPEEVPGMPSSFTLPVGGTIDLAAMFSDPDGDALTYSLAASSDQVSLAGTTLTATAVGTAEVTVIADDGKG